jgi:hypothetical protein
MHRLDHPKTLKVSKTWFQCVLSILAGRIGFGGLGSPGDIGLEGCYWAEEGCYWVWAGYIGKLWLWIPCRCGGVYFKMTVNTSRSCSSSCSSGGLVLGSCVDTCSTSNTLFLGEMSFSICMLSKNSNDCQFRVKVISGLDAFGLSNEKKILACCRFYWYSGHRRGIVNNFDTSPLANTSLGV